MQQATLDFTAARALGEQAMTADQLRRRDKESVLSAEFVKSILDYDANTGIFIWKKKLRNRKGFVVAGSIDSGKHRQIKINGVLYMAHRLAWLITYGEWPRFDIDHINVNPDDNRIENLRELKLGVNVQNKRCANRNSRLGILGVSIKKKRFVAQISVSGVVRHIGYFDSTEAAHDAYIKAKRWFHEGCTL